MLLTFILFAANLLGGATGGPHADAGSAPVISARVLHNDAGRPVADSPILFTVTSNRDGLTIYKDWNSWGYYDRFFTVFVRDDPSASYVIEKRSRGWRGNYPATLVLNRGQSLDTKMDLCDGSWTVVPALKGRPASPLSLVPQFRIDDGKTAPVWTGHVSGEPVDVYLSRHCRNLLNEDGP
jgi:hypothetical protein